MANGSKGGGAFPFLLGLVIGGLILYFLCPRIVEPKYPEKVKDLPKERYAAYTQQIQEEILLPPRPRCDWPFYCEGIGGDPIERQAIDLLNEIEVWVQDEPIDPGRKDRIVQHCARCRDPMLKSTDGIPVCEIENPEPCGQLKQRVYAAAKAAKYPEPPVPPEQKDALWETVEDEFRKFPGDR